MFGPGAYRPDSTEGIATLVDLPPPEIVPSNRTYTRQACPRCSHQAYRDKQFQRSCPSSMRLNTRSLPGDRHHGTTALPIGPSGRHSGPLHRDDALEAGCADARRHLRPPPVAVPTTTAGSYSRGR
jgi:hypothetical protein